MQEPKPVRALIERLEKLTGPDREVDEVILKFLGFHSWAGRMSYRQAPMWIDFGSSEITTSLDAAVALCERELPGWHWRVSKYQGEVFQKDPECGHDGHGPSPAIALVLATLRAIEASKGGRDG